MIPPPMNRRNAHITITTRQKLRPEFLDEANPNTAPTPAINMISQFSQPSSGTNPMIARTSATSPKRNAMMLAIH